MPVIYGQYTATNIKRGKPRKNSDFNILNADYTILNRKDTARIYGEISESTTSASPARRAFCAFCAFRILSKNNVRKYKIIYAIYTQYTIQ